MRKIYAFSFAREALAHCVVQQILARHHTYLSSSERSRSPEEATEPLAFFFFLDVVEALDPFTEETVDGTFGFCLWTSGADSAGGSATELRRTFVDEAAFDATEGRARRLESA